MLPARGISKKSIMASDHLHSPADDSLEEETGRGSSRLLHSRAAQVGPEDLREKPDLKAFSEEDESDGGSLCPDLLSRGDLLLLQDRASGKNRTLGVERLHAAVESAESAAVLEANLPALVKEACSAMADSHIKVCLAGLQLLDPLIRRTGSSLAPLHIPALVEAVLAKMGRNKHVLKKNGMEVMVLLMHYSRPQDVVTEVASFGLRHRHSKVREEALNVITAGLIRFSRSEFRLVQLAKDVLPLLADPKPHVRQASMECVAKITSLCDKDDFRQVMSLAARNGHHTPHDFAALKALECRVVRECGPPRLGEDGLIQYAMTVVGVDIPPSQHGPDVDWIREGAMEGRPTLPNGLEESSVGRKEAKTRPFRSATKKLPWEADEEEKSKLSKESDTTNSRLSDTTADLSSTFSLQKKTKNTGLPLTHKQPPSSKLLFAKDRSTSPPTHRPPTGRRLAPLSDAEKKWSPSHSPNGSSSPLLIHDLRDMVPPPPSRGGPLPPPIPLPSGAKFSQRHQSLPSRAMQHRLTNGRSPRLSPIGSPVTGERSHKEQDKSLPPAALPPGELSESWPRSRVGTRGKKVAEKPAELITADPLKTVGEVGDQTQTSLHRPPSKPRALNPIARKQKLGEKKVKNTLLHQQLQGGAQDSPTQTEKEFLMCGNTTLQDDDYYSSVPEDTTGLENSLSSSLTSLCRPPREPANPANMTITQQVNNVEQDRKEVASRKAMHRSAGCTLSHSPQPAHDETPVGPSRHNRHKPNNKEPVTEPVADTSERRARTGVRVEKDFNRTFTLGESLAHADPSAVSWQTLQALAQSAPLPPAPKKPADKKAKKKKQNSGSNEGSGSLEGSGTILLERRKRSGNKGDSPALDAGRSQSHRCEPPRRSLENGERRRSLELDEENCQLPTVRGGLRKSGRRLTFERGAADTIGAEANGTDSPSLKLSPDELSPPEPPPRATGRPRKQRHSEPAFNFGGDKTEYGSSPKVNRSITFSDESPDGSEGLLLPEVPRQPRKRQSKYAVSKGRDGHPSQSNRHPAHRRRRSLEDSGPAASENGSPPSGSIPPDLHPFSNADRGLRNSLSQLDSSDWNEKCEGLLGVRRLAAYHTTRLLPELHTVTLAVVKEVENLRSSVARTAIACLGDVFVYAGQHMDPELERVVKVLLHKTGESNVFMREDVEKTMHQIVQHASPGKLLLALISGGHSHRNVQVRRAAAQFLSQTVAHCGPAELVHASRDLLERTLTATLSFITDAAADSRYFGRVCLSHFMTVPDFEKVASRTLNSQQWSKMRDAMDMIRVKGVGDSPGEAAPSRSRQPTGGAVRNTAANHSVKTSGGGPKASTAKASAAVHCGENPPLPDRLVERLNAGSWEDRQEAINVLERFVDKHPKALEPHMHKVFDAFNPRLTDRNSKVNLRALEAFSNMIPLLGRLLAPLSANIIKALMPNLASKNSHILHAATTVFDILSQCVDPGYLIQPIATHSQHGNARVQPIMINKLAELAVEVYSYNQRLVVRQVLPVMWYFLASKPPGSNDVKEAIVALCGSLYNAMGQNFLDSASNLPPQSQVRLNQLLHSGNFN